MVDVQISTSRVNTALLLRSLYRIHEFCQLLMDVAAWKGDKVFHY